ncbi:dipeptide/oligopeptide/nickel ABC transporter permease/ATP-binding protein [Nakamurella aerolata]|uniref:Dipeptide/oligopeptide/nickel ABC transporter permease/ATP-binding protein n=1 Tax=Nakamurella aerolata TaxID=1656892 RepID=A0A849AAR7_9ACTN|nr:dipeptide/oligopeptide/nickel ABC transporter permease/ATP-binding protein [Nakamurella aerolata]NNG36723.1 dipeptide/oligopeptide/nickel ABC transporter permease/ATP-binding protein [Nakamurella aerolata]
MTSQATGLIPDPTAGSLDPDNTTVAVGAVGAGDSGEPAAPARDSQQRRRGFVRRFVRKPVAMTAFCWLVIVVLGCVFAPLLAPYGPEDQDLMAALSTPSAAHPLGAGELGLDVLSRLLYGGRITLLGVLISCTVFAVLGVLAGMIAGFRGGWVDRLVMWLANLAFALPAVIILLVVLAIFPNNETAAMVALGILGAPGLARIVRSVTLGLREELYVKAARLSGLGTGTILRRHLLPRLAGPIIVQVSLFGAAAVGLETGLGFLGLGVTTATWGTLAAEANSRLADQPWLLVPTGFVIITFILALGLLGDGIRDTLAERYSLQPSKKRRRRRSAPADGAAVRPDAHRQRKARPAAAASAAADSTADAAGRATDVDGAPDPLLQVDGLTVAFPNQDGCELTVVQDVSFSVGAGEAVGIVGESGCGKTVTASAILGLLRGGGRITAGSVRLDDTELTTADAATMRSVRGGRIGWISQDPIASLDPSFTAGHHLVEAIRVHRGGSKAVARQRARELLELVRIPDPERMLRSYPHQLSGGMAQRVGIACALACDPQLVIADEPTTALDVTVQADILQLLRTLQASGTAVILVTHDWGVLADLCQRAVVMYAGEVIEQAPLQELIDRPAHPYTRGLLRSNPHQAVRGEPLPTVRGTVPAPSHWPAGCHFADRCELATSVCRAEPVTLHRVSAERSSRCLRIDQLLPRPDVEQVAGHAR